MANKDQYLENLRTTLKGSSPQNEAEEGSVGGTDSQDYYDMLRSESYKTMLSKEVQAHNAQQQALKYTGIGLKGSGYGTQGVSESAHLGIGNNLGTALREAQTEYESSLQNIAQQERQAHNDEFESLTTLMGNATSSSQLGEMLTEYGYANVDENGNLTWNEKGMEGLDENTKRQLKILYSMYASELQNNEWLSQNTLNGMGYRDAGTAIQNIVDAKGEQGTVSNELRQIFSDAYLNGKEDGFAVKLVNGNDDGKVVYMILRNGTWYQTNGAVFNAAASKETLKGAK